MSKSPFSTAKFKKLQEKWYKKAAKAGFEEIEDTNSPHENLKKWDSHYFSARYKPAAFEAKKLYFENATYYLEWGVFASPVEKEVWALHAEGLAYPEIVKKTKVSLDRVSKIVQKHRKNISCK